MGWLQGQILAQMRAQNSLWEDRLSLVIKPRPAWLPEWVWTRLLSMLLVQEIERVKKRLGND